MSLKSLPRNWSEPWFSNGGLRWKRCRNNVSMEVCRADVKMYLASVSVLDCTNSWRCLALAWACSMACPSRTFVKREVDALCAFSPGRNWRSSGAFSLATALEGHLSARSARVRKPASANEH
eukprot:6483125-Amphidinium_carterae.1